MSQNYYLGFDVGGTKIEGALCILNPGSRSLTVLSSLKVETPKSSPEFILVLTSLIKELVEQTSIKKEDIKALSFGLPGTLHPQTKIMLNGNTQFLIGMNLKMELQNFMKDYFGNKIPLFLENDANCFILAEAWAGAGLLYEETHKINFKDQVAIGITLGTGVGGGLLSRGEILAGASGAGMEVGHISLNPKSGTKCYCGQLGCAETYLSGTALNQIIDSKELFLRAKKSDPQAMTILASYRENMLHFLSVLINLINPHYIVFGGGLSHQQLLFEGLKSDLPEKLFLSKELPPEIFISQLPMNAGVYGALINAYNHQKEKN